MKYKIPFCKEALITQVWFIHLMLNCSEGLVPYCLCGTEEVSVKVMPGLQGCVMGFVGTHQ